MLIDHESKQEITDHVEHTFILIRSDALIVKKVILDTDPGVDDAMAIFFALASSELEIVGLTTVFGNADIKTTTKNALALLEIADRKEIPVVSGANKPIDSPYPGPVPHVHGENGLGNATIPPVSGSPLSSAVSEWMYQQVCENPGEITILAVGPLTNLALALMKYPDLPGLVDKIVVMGGNALVPGNATPAAEANMFNDPEAADLVFGASWHVTMVGLDVTHQVILNGQLINKLTGVSNRSNQFLSAAIPFYQDFFERTNGIDGMYLHDPTAVAYLIAPELFTIQEWPVRVETQSFSRGKTWPSLGDTDDSVPAAWQDRPDVSICTNVDDQAVVDLFVSRLA